MTRIFINFPTNLGDVILALPALDRLKGNFPESRITAIVSTKTKDFLFRHNLIDELVLYDKSWPMDKKREFAFSLRGKFDVAVDLKNTFFPVISGAKLRTPLIRFFPKNMHITDKYLGLISKFTSPDKNIRGEFILEPKEKDKWDKSGIVSSVFIACSSRSIVKKYPYQNLKEMVELLEKDYHVVILGVQDDRSFYADILKLKGVVDLVGKTSMIDIFYLLKNYACLVVGVDSSILHFASYLNVPCVSMFGPTHPGRSYPKSKGSVILCNEELACRPCEKPTCKFNHECMKVDARDIAKAVRKILNK
ncbi:MAG: glycosyltransferase family 9 protein [Candidatus Omnitrophica bacterium]|nr:glycosyltransferase family 9 protein [Candidatus Omnitrophota bacterium]